MGRCHVVALIHDADENVRCRTDVILILDTRMCQVEVFGGEVTKLSANIIADSMYALLNADRNEYLLLNPLINHCNDKKVISLMDQQTSILGRPVTHKSTAGWKICYHWKDSSTSWEKLSDLKESHPLQTADFAVAHGINHEHAFNWWVKHVL